MLSLKLLLSSVCLAPLLILAADPAVVIKETQVKETSPASGKEMFNEYCASCHGIDAKGHGPAASATKVPPPDLTLLSQNNHGKFPGVHVYAAIQGDVNLAVHGSKTMPVWGNVFRQMNGAIGSPQASARTSNLCRYIESLQQK